jgi:hypothetical protein
MAEDLFWLGGGRSVLGPTMTNPVGSNAFDVPLSWHCTWLDSTTPHAIQVQICHQSCKTPLVWHSRPDGTKFVWPTETVVDCVSNLDAVFHQQC